jgi:hypothetical protein
MGGYRFGTMEYVVSEMVKGSSWTRDSKIEKGHRGCFKTISVYKFKVAKKIL